MIKLSWAKFTKFSSKNLESCNFLSFGPSCWNCIFKLPRSTAFEQLFLASLGQVIRCSKAVNLGSLNMQFQHDWPKDKKITALLIFWPENLEKYRSTEHYGAPLEGSTFFLCRSSLGSTAMESCPLAQLKCAIFSRAGSKTKKLPRSKLFYRWPLSMGS